MTSRNQPLALLVVLVVLASTAFTANLLDRAYEVNAGPDPRPDIPEANTPTSWVENQPGLPANFSELVKPKAKQSQTRVRAQGWDGTPGFVNGNPCGGDLPPCSVLRCESGGVPTKKNPTSTASGLWQALRSTWGGYGGYPEAWLAPVDVQNAHARALWNGGRGWRHWKSCI